MDTMQQETSTFISLWLCTSESLVTDNNAASDTDCYCITAMHVREFVERDTMQHEISTLFYYGCRSESVMTDTTQQETSTATNEGAMLQPVSPQ